MSNKLLFLIGIFGVSLFVISAIVGGMLIENYSITSQYISESYAIDTEHGETLRFFGYLPSGILLTLFAFLGHRKFPKSSLTKIGFWGLGIFYGIATIIVSFFPCDSGCNRAFIDPSISQIIHNLTGFMTYLFVPMSILIISIGLWKSKEYRGLAKLGFIGALISIGFVGLLSDPLTNYAGLFQRVVEGVFIIWFIACAFYIKKGIQIDNTAS